MELNVLQVDKLESDKCYQYQISVTAVNEKGNSTPDYTNYTNIICDAFSERVVGEYR